MKSKLLSYIMLVCALMYTSHLTAASWTVTNSAELVSALTNCTDGDIIEITSSFTLASTPAAITGKTITITAEKNTDGTPKYTINGDGLYRPFNTSGGNVTIENLIVNNCKGDAINISGAATLNNVYSTNNVNGSGMAIWGTSTIVLNDCVISGNTKGTSAYGIYCNGATDLTLNNCTISGNYGVRGTATGSLKAIGFMIKTSGAKATLNNCTISGNYQDGRNTGSDYSEGYGVLVDTGASLMLNGCTISGNYAVTTSASADSRTAGFGIRAYGDAVVNKCIIAGNYGIDNSGKKALGKGIYVKGNVSITNSTIAGNYGGSDSNQGSGYGVDLEGKVSISNSTIANNLGVTSGEGINVNSSSAVIDVYNSIAYDQTNDFNNAGGGTVNVYSSVHGSVTGTVTETNNLAIDGSTNTLVLNYYDKNNTVIPTINATTAPTIAYAKVTETGTTNAVYTTADKTNITADKLSKANGTVLSTYISSVVTESYATTALNEDQLGVARSFNSNGKYVPGSVYSEFNNGTATKSIDCNYNIDVKAIGGNLTIDADGNSIQKVQIVSPSGKIVKSLTPHTSSFQCSLTDSQSGIYIINVNTSAGNKIVKIMK